MIVIRQLNKLEIHRINEIDRTERVKILYNLSGGKLELESVDIDVLRWDHPDWRHDASLMKEISEKLDNGGVLFGAFDKERLVGISGLGYQLIGENKDEIQMFILHVSNEYRRKGIGTKLLEECKRIAREKGARRLYISATPTESAVGFYLRHGCRLASKVDEELLALEPEDIHLTLEL